MKRLFYLLFGLVLLPALLYAQGTLSLKDINDNLTNNYYTKTVSDSKYATSTDISAKADKTYVDANFATTAENALKQNIADMVDYYTKTAADLLLADKATTAAVALKADKTYVDGTDEAQAAAIALKANITSVYTTAEVDALLTAKLDVATITNYYLKTETYNTGEIALLLAAKANTADVYDTAAINLLLTDKADTSSVTAVSDLLAAHTGEVSGAHQGTAIAVDSSGFTGNLSLDDNTAQKAFAKLDALSGLPATNAITKIYGDADVDGCDTGAVWLVGTNGVQIYRSGNTFEANIENATKFGGYYTKAETNATIEAAIAAIPAPSVNQTVTVTAGEALTAGQVVSLINESGTMKAYNNPLTVNTSPNGAESVFNSAATTYCSAVALDSTRFLVAYVDSDNFPRAIVGTVTGSTIAWGSESSVFESVATAYITSCKIATDKVLIAYSDGTNAKARMIVLTISTNTISNGTPADLLSSQISNTSLTQLDTNKAIICYRNSGVNSYGHSKIITVSATTPTPYPAADSAGTEFNAAVTSYISVSALSSTEAIVAYRDDGNSNYGTAQILSISGTTITPGTEYVFNSAVTAHISIDMYNSTIGCVSYRDETAGGTQYYPFVKHITNNSGELLFGASSNPLAAGSTYTNVKFLDANHILFFSRDTAVASGKSALGNINNNTITFGATNSFNTGIANYISGCFLNSQKTIICYSDEGNSSYGTAVVNTWATTNYASVSGISSGAYSSGSDAVVLISGTYDGLSSLIPGSPYFVNASFELQTTPVSLTSTIYSGAATTREIHFGTAKSSTEIVLNIDYR
jgi:hypothetical protein